LTDGIKQFLHILFEPEDLSISWLHPSNVVY
jgi:hypothetical protein